MTVCNYHSDVVSMRTIKIITNLEEYCKATLVYECYKTNKLNHIVNHYQNHLYLQVLS